MKTNIKKFYSDTEIHNFFVKCDTSRIIALLEKKSSVRTVNLLVEDSCEFTPQDDFIDHILF